MNKRLTLMITSILLCGGICSAQQPIGKSMGRWKEISTASMEQNRKGGLEYIEVTINDFRHKAASEEEVLERARKRLAEIKASGLKVWSVHLPFSRTLDISVLDDKARTANVALMARMIELAGEFNPQFLVLHPSSEPIDAGDRPQRMANSHASIGQLAPAAQRIGATLCVENLPRTCLGQTGEEMLQLIDGYKDVRLCFDTNHLFYQSHADYLKAVGKGRIATVHLSDYDFENECHWIPGQGRIDWGSLWRGICKAGYRGIMLFECYGEPQELTAARQHILESAEKEKKPSRNAKKN